jgi:hypothetical protein
MTVKRFLKAALPTPIVRRIREYRNRDYQGLSLEQVFTKIYESGAWSRRYTDEPQYNDEPFFSGSGSRFGRGSRYGDEVSDYVRAVEEFLSLLPSKPDAVDLGCGDFAVGSLIRPFCRNYIACDVVRGVIDHNRQRFGDLDVEFRALDFTEDDLPEGDVVFVRQVLQHLSNAQIGRFLARASKYKYLIVTEHWPDDVAGFKANIDKPTGPGTRVGYPSGVVLTSAPFNLRPESEHELCRVKSFDGGVLVTTAYGLS